MTEPERARLTVMGTTDLHGQVLNWDYFTDAGYADVAGNHIGLAKVASLVAATRASAAERGDHTLLIDAGDTIQGTPLTYYYSRIEPITGGAVHPMAATMNAIGFDAAALGNHEFDYGIEHLRAWQAQLDFPLLGANAVDWTTGEPAFAPYVLKTIGVGKRRLTVGILGLTNPGTAIWSKVHVAGRMRFPGLVEQARVWVPKMRAAGADVVIVAAHSGATLSSSYGAALPYPENASSALAEQVPGIAAILVGHAHVEIPERFVTNAETGTAVLLTEPLCWGMRLSLIELAVERTPAGGWELTSAGSRVLDSRTVPEDPQVVALIEPQHKRVIGYVNSVIGTCARAMTAATARYEDTAALDFINAVQARAVRAALVGTPEGDTPVLSMAAPFNREAAIPAGAVTVRDVAGLYVFDNTVLGVRLTGAQLCEYLERSAAYYRRVDGPGPYRATEVTNNPSDTAPAGIPDYNYDIAYGLAAPLTYDIDIAEPIGSRITRLAYDGQPVQPDQRFIVALNSYRQSGGGNFPYVTTADIVYDEQRETRQLLIDEVSAAGAIDPADFHRWDWRLVAHGEPVRIEP